MQLRRTAKLALPVFLLLGAAGCDRQPYSAPDARGVGDVRPYVTGEAALSLTSDGQFGGAALTANAEPDAIDSKRAIALAEAYIRTFGKYFQETWQEQRGEALTLAKLRASRVAFASTPYEPLPKNVHPGLRKAFGSYYLVWFTEDGDPSLLLAVAANNGDVKIDSDGQLLLPKLSGGEFRGQGIPRSQSAGAARRFMPLTPEQAVITLGQASGAKIREVPELVLLEISNAPVTAAWRLVLDRRIPIEGAPLSETQELLVTTDPTSRHTVAAADQPAGMNYPLLVVDGEGTEGRETTVYVALRPGARIRYEKATPRMGGGL